MRKPLFWLHLIAGSLAGLVVLIMSVTGVLLAYERQILSASNAGFRSAVPSAAAAHMPVETILSTLPPQKEKLTAIAIGSTVDAPLELSFGRERTLFIDAYRGTRLGEASTRLRRFFGVVENTHRWLALPARENGRAITGAANLAFLILVLSGLFLWWPRQWTRRHLQPILRFRFDAAGRTRDWNWHNVVGIWSAFPLFVIVLTGVVMSYPWANDLLYRVTGNEPPRAGERPAEAPRTRVDATGDAVANGRRGGSTRAATRSSYEGVDRALATAASRMHGWKRMTVRLQGGASPLTVAVERGSSARPDLRTQFTFDRSSGAITKAETFASQNAGRRLRAWFRWLHTGEALGIVGQTVAMLASLGATLLVWTGLSLALRRLYRFIGRRKTEVLRPS